MASKKRSGYSVKSARSLQYREERYLATGEIIGPVAKISGTSTNVSLPSNTTASVGTVASQEDVGQVAKSGGGMTFPDLIDKWLTKAMWLIVMAPAAAAYLVALATGHMKSWPEFSFTSLVALVLLVATLVLRKCLK